MASNEQLLSFYYGEAPDTRGRFLRQILNWPDDELERTHDYIQWLFPLDEPSGFNLDAPILDVDTIRKFRLSPPLRRNLQTSLLRMLRFYGLELRPTVPLRVVCAPNFAERAANWITPYNHNHLRITRILKSLRLLGLKRDASAFYDCLLEICRQEFDKASPRISRETRKYWQSAATQTSIDPSKNISASEKHFFDEIERSLDSVGELHFRFLAILPAFSRVSLCLDLSLYCPSVPILTLDPYTL